MSAALKLASTDTGLFPYPIPAKERLETHFFMTWHHRRWLDSDFRNLADREVRSVGFDLFCIAQGQAPVGTLPTDDRLLAKLVGEPLEVWKALCERSVSPLHNWKRCLCDNGEVRLYHEVTMQMAQSALGLREDHLEKKTADRERKRLIALPAQMVRAGARKQMAEDELFVIRLDQFMLEHFPNQQRRPNIVREALEAMEMASQKGEVA